MKVSYVKFASFSTSERIDGMVKVLTYILQKWHSKMHGLWCGRRGEKVPKDQHRLKPLPPPPLKYEANSHSSGRESVPKGQFFK